MSLIVGGIYTVQPPHKGIDKALIGEVDENYPIEEYEHDVYKVYLICLKRDYESHDMVDKYHEIKALDAYVLILLQDGSEALVNKNYLHTNENEIGEIVETLPRSVFNLL